MKTETLTERLERLLPGATVRERRDAVPHRRFIVERRAKDGFVILADGATAREAVDRAVFLWAVQR